MGRAQRIGREALDAQEARNLKRFETKLQGGAEETAVSKLPNDTSRLQVLEDLVEHRVPARESQARLAGFAWDEEELVDLEVRHVVAVLTQLVDGEIDAAEATEWADAVDLRDDLGRQPGRETQINDALLAMSSPELLDEDLVVVARRLLTDLQSTP